jgi:hypothetical protein
MLKRFKDLLAGLGIVRDRVREVPVTEKVDSDYLRMYAEINSSYNAVKKVRDNMAVNIKAFLLTRKNHTFKKPDLLAYLWEKAASKVVLPDHLKQKYTEKYTQEIVKVEVKDN